MKTHFYNITTLYELTKPHENLMILHVSKHETGKNESNFMKLHEITNGAHEAHVIYPRNVVQVSGFHELHTTKQFRL